jgi:hypothetical protein
MIYGETKERDKVKQEFDFFVIALSLILTLIVTWMILFGPRSVLLQ